MKTLFLALSLSALAFSGAAGARDLAKVPATKTVYEGIDAQGRIVRVTVASPENDPSVAVSSAPPQYPALHWTAHIGSGTAATIAH
jgi:hypothetical protein